MSDESILTRVQSDMTAAMKSRDADTLSTLRMLKAALMEAKTRKPRETALTHDEEIDVLQRYARKRRETIEELKRVGREDLVAREEREIAVTERYLPQRISEDELRVMVRETVASTGATSAKEMGKVIGAVMSRVKGRADGATVSRLVKEALGI
ncbi:MAG TPA: GatB/YqeY domain-containing protein [Terriglobales bacterium]|nr:GatB/YqeY domain-containing protein [Terriglobales bacterium]